MLAAIIGIGLFGAFGWAAFFTANARWYREMRLRIFWKMIADDNGASSKPETMEKWKEWFDD